MKTLSLRSLFLILLLLVFTACTSAPTHAQDADPQPGDADPWVGEYTAFAQWAGAYLSESRWWEPDTITQDGVGYRFSREPEVLLIEQAGTLAPQGQSDWLREIRSGGRLGPGSLTLGATFQILYLHQGVGPSAEYLFPDDNRGDERWAYSVSVRDEHTAHESLYGELTLHIAGHDAPDPIGEQFPLGSIIITPVGKYMFFGDPDDAPASWPRPTTGWHNTLRGERANFNDDGSLTELGRACRETLLAEQRALFDIYQARRTLENMVTREQVEHFVAAVEPGMWERAVYNLVDSHFNALDRVGEEEGEGTFSVTFSCPESDPAVYFTLHFVWDTQREQWVTPPQGTDAVTVQWEEQP